MTKDNAIRKMRSELEAGMGLAKCRKCGCMKETLENLQTSFSPGLLEASPDWLATVEHWLGRMEPVQYGCLGCEYCFPVVAMNSFQPVFPEARQSASLGCAFEVNERGWPPVAGEYKTFCDGPGCPVAVSTLASAELAERLARIRPEALCIVGKTETENIGIDKIIRNTVTNPTIRFLLLAGKDPEGHQSGRTLLALGENGVDENMKVVGSPGRHPVLRNVTREEVEAFRKQARIVDLIGCEDEERIVEKIKELSRAPGSSCCGGKPREKTELVGISGAPAVRAQKPARVEMDKAGYFVILPQPERQNIVVEHYAYDNALQRVIEGKDAQSLYGTIIENGWVTQLSHAAYLGRELGKAELSIALGFKYVQDGA